MIAWFFAGQAPVFAFGYAQNILIRIHLCTEVCAIFEGRIASIELKSKAKIAGVRDSQS
jgi:hypothetical protein